jgi:hypothetical protein
MDQIFGGLIPNQPEQDRPEAGPQCAEAAGPDREVRCICSLLGGRPGRAGSFGLIRQFGVGVDNIDLEAAADEVAWVANMPGLNAVPVADHAVALLLAPARRLPEASKGFEPGRWGRPAGRSLAGTAASIVGAGAIGTQIARRLAAFLGQPRRVLLRFAPHLAELYEAVPRGRRHGRPRLGIG